jgi:hypothetical protein
MKALLSDVRKGAVSRLSDDERDPDLYETGDLVIAVWQKPLRQTTGRSYCYDTEIGVVLAKQKYAASPETTRDKVAAFVLWSFESR